MKIVIDIDKAIYKIIKEGRTTVRHSGKTILLEHLMEAINEGTPLPKGHGRLIDADAFITTLKDASKRHKYKELMINDCLTVDDVFKAIIESLLNEGLAEGDTPTIIEADKTQKEK